MQTAKPASYNQSKQPSRAPHTSFVQHGTQPCNHLPTRLPILQPKSTPCLPVLTPISPIPLRPNPRTCTRDACSDAVLSASAAYSVQANWNSPKSYKNSGSSGPSSSYWFILSAKSSLAARAAGDITVATVGLKDTALTKWLKTIWRLGMVNLMVTDSVEHAEPLRCQKALELFGGLRCKPLTLITTTYVLMHENL